VYFFSKKKRIPGPGKVSEYLLFMQNPHFFISLLIKPGGIPEKNLPLPEFHVKIF